MRILLIASAYNSMTQRVHAELADRGHEVSVELALGDEVMRDGVRRYDPDLIIAPMLTRAIPEDIWSARPCFIVHPGPMGDRGPSSLDWAIMGGAARWGVTVLQANAEMDAAKKAGKVIVKDAIADIALQQVLTRSDEFDVIATLNLNGDYISDALAAQVGGIGIAPGGNINYLTGHAVFEATHGTAPKYANLDKVNPGSVILSGEMMLRYMGWTEAADALITAMDKAIAAKTVTYDFARLMDGATEVKCSEFGDALIKAL